MLGRQIIRDHVRLAEVLLALTVLVLLIGRLPASPRDEPPIRPEDLALRVHLNRADASDLVALPGIGPARARAIVLDRRARGPFSGPEALTRVHGIGPATVERIRPHLYEE